MRYPNKERHLLKADAFLCLSFVAEKDAVAGLHKKANRPRRRTGHTVPLGYSVLAPYKCFDPRQNFVAGVIHLPQVILITKGWSRAEGGGIQRDTNEVAYLKTKVYYNTIGYNL